MQGDVGDTLDFLLSIKYNVHISLWYNILVINLLTRQLHMLLCLIPANRLGEWRPILYRKWLVVFSHSYDLADLS